MDITVAGCIRLGFHRRE